MNEIKIGEYISINRGYGAIPLGKCLRNENGTLVCELDNIELVIKSQNVVNFICRVYYDVEIIDCEKTYYCEKIYFSHILSGIGSEKRKILGYVFSECKGYEIICKRENDCSKVDVIYITSLGWLSNTIEPECDYVPMDNFNIQNDLFRGYGLRNCKYLEIDFENVRLIPKNFRKKGSLTKSCCK